MIAVFNRTRAASIPYDVQWNDIDAMENHLDFTYDQAKFAKLPQFVDDLHKVGMKYIPMFDPGISAKEEPGKYPPYDLGIEMDIFIKNSSGKPFIGKVWPGPTVFPDYTNPKATDYWTKLFDDYHKVIPYDGSWIDINEPSIFVPGSEQGSRHVPTRPLRTRSTLPAPAAMT